MTRVVCAPSEPIVIGDRVTVAPAAKIVAPAPLELGMPIQPPEDICDGNEGSGTVMGTDYPLAAVRLDDGRIVRGIHYHRLTREKNVEP